MHPHTTEPAWRAESRGQQARWSDRAGVGATELTPRTRRDRTGRDGGGHEDDAEPSKGQGEAGRRRRALGRGLRRRRGVVTPAQPQGEGGQILGLGGQLRMCMPRKWCVRVWGGCLCGRMGADQLADGVRATGPRTFLHVRDSGCAVRVDCHRCGQSRGTGQRGRCMRLEEVAAGFARARDACAWGCGGVSILP